MSNDILFSPAIENRIHCICTINGMIVLLMGKVMQIKTRLFYNVEYILLGETPLQLRVPTPPQLGLRPPTHCDHHKPAAPKTSY